MRKLLAASREAHSPSIPAGGKGNVAKARTAATAIAHCAAFCRTCNGTGRPRSLAGEGSIQLCVDITMPAAPAITEEKALALFRAACAGGMSAGVARVTGQKKGSINQIFHIEAGERHFALRVRYNECRFQYEKGVFKEVFAALLLADDEGAGAVPERKLANTWARLAGARSSGRIRFPCGPDILYFDFTGTEYPAPWAVLEWTGEALGAEMDAAHAFQLGKSIAQLHRLKFKHAYSTLDRLQAGGVDILEEWKTEIVQRNRNTENVIAAEEDLLAALHPLLAAARAVPADFVLCHNDLHCLNVTQKHGALTLVDWDNAQIAPKELDFVKLAHWSRLGPDGRFAPDPALFAAFCAGYGAPAACVPGSPLFKLAELLWLFRVLNFPTASAEPPNPPFWPPQRYAALLRERLAPAPPSA